MNQSKSFIKCFSEMDISGLRNSLNEKTIYFKCSKKVFLDKVNDVFTFFRSAGETELGHLVGKCGWKECANFENLGHCFVGKKSGYYIGFVFTNGNINEGLCVCYNFKLNDSSIDLGYKVPFRVSYTEEASYINTFKNFSPFVELKRLEEENLFSMARIEWWLMKYKEYFDNCTTDDLSYDFIGKPDDSMVFVELYKNLDEITQIKRQTKQYNLAVLEFNTLDKTHKNYKEWVIKYEELGFGCFDWFYYRYFNEKDQDLEICIGILSGEAEDIFIDNSEFKGLMEFFDIFEDLFWNEKVFTESENYKSITNRMHSDITESFDF